MLKRDWSYLSPMGSQNLPRAKKRQWLKFWGSATTLGFYGLIGLVILIIGLFVFYSRDLPSPYKLTQRDVSLSTKIYDRNENLLYDVYGNQNRALVKLSELPQYLIDATISIEDKDFYKHGGFSQTGIARALFNILFRGKLQGGSTLTQQVVKNILLTPERTIPRKIKEFILAIQVEQRYSKDEILQIYLNEVPYGGTAWGIEAASETYFDKKASDLTLTEASVLAGLPQKPTAYSPFGSNPAAFIDRAKAVARRMREDGKISEKQEEKIAAELPNLEFAPQGAAIRAPHFVIYVRDLLTEQFGQRIVEQGGLRVTTSLDLKLQDQAQKIVAEEISKLERLRVGNGAALVTNPATGEILAMVGSKDYFATDYDGEVNVTLSRRQPGSAIKPVTYSTAFAKGFTPSFLIMDVQTEFPGGENLPVYKPGNYDDKFRGPMQARYALGNSINLAAVKMLALVGIEDMLKTANDLGLTTLAPTKENLERFGLSLTLGGGEVRLLDMATAFGVFANYGVRIDPVVILKVTDSSGKVLFEYDPPKGRRVLSEEVSFLISDILSDNAARATIFGQNSLIKIGENLVAVKTGTTDDKRDNWTVGFTTGETPTVVGVWVGNNDNSPMHPSLASGTTGAAPIWRRTMLTVLKNRPAEGFKVPKNIAQLEIDALAGGLPCPGYPTRVEYFTAGTQPTRACLVQRDFGGSQYLVFTEEDPVSTDGRNRWQEGINNWLAAQPDSRYHPPPELAGSEIGRSIQQVGSDQLVVNILRPAPTSQVSGQTEIEAQVLSGEAIEIVEFWLDDGFMASKGSAEGENGVFIFKYDFSLTSDGTHRIEIRATNRKGVQGKSDVEVTV